jgi:hypothetical protein
MRRHPDLASAVERHLRGDPPVAATLRAACAFPGREQLLGGPIASAPVFRAVDVGATWARQIDPPEPLVLALREEIERQSWEQPAPPARLRRQRDASPLPPGAPQGRGRAGRSPRAPPRQGVVSAGPASTATAQAMLSFVDPARLLAHFNSGLQLTAVSGGIAVAPTPEYWDALVAALVAESEAEGEISLGPGVADYPRGAAFEVLRSGDGGTWRSIESIPPGAPPGIVAYPESIAAADGQAFFVLAGRSRNGARWRVGWRIRAP